MCFCELPLQLVYRTVEAFCDSLCFGSCLLWLVYKKCSICSYTEKPILLFCCFYLRVIVLLHTLVQHICTAFLHTSPSVQRSPMVEIIRVIFALCWGEDNIHRHIQHKVVIFSYNEWILRECSFLAPPVYVYVPLGKTLNLRLAQWVRPALCLSCTCVCVM